MRIAVCMSSNPVSLSEITKKVPLTKKGGGGSNCVYDPSGSIASVVMIFCVLTAAATSDCTGIAPRESRCSRACACALYGRPETRPLQENASGEKMSMDARVDSADTQPDNSEYDGPSLGA